jgi:hypothetical protein
MRIAVGLMEIALANRSTHSPHPWMKSGSEGRFVGWRVGIQGVEYVLRSKNAGAKAFYVEAGRFA